MKKNKVVFGVDIGGTTIKIGLFTIDGRLLEKATLATNKENKGEHLFSDLEEFLREILQKRNIDLSLLYGIGIGLPGPVIDGRYVNGCVNIGLPYTDVLSRFNFSKDVIIKVENDARLATLAEYHYGAGKDFSTIMLLTLGTGIGSGCVIKGKLITGSTGSAGEIGHIQVPQIFLDELASNDFCDLEALASGISIERLAKRFLELNIYKSTLNDMTPSAKNIFEQAKEKDELALKLVDIMCHYLGLGISYASAVVNPAAIIFGGGVSRAGDILIDKIKEYYLKYAFKPLKDCEILAACLENDAGIYGSYSLVCKGAENVDL